MVKINDGEVFVNLLRINREALQMARMQFCLDMGLSWEEYVQQPKQKVYIRKASYKEGTELINTEGARVYEGRNDFFHAIICLGQLFLVVDEQLYGWAVEKFTNYPPEWFCRFDNLRTIDEKLKEYGHRIKDTHVYMLPEAAGLGTVCKNPQGPTVKCTQNDETYVWYSQEEILNFQGNNKFSSAICFSKTQPDMLAVAAVKGITRDCVTGEKPFDQSGMSGMAGVSADGEYLWQIGINVVKEAESRGVATRLVRMMKDAVIRQGKTPFYGTSESHSISQTVGLKAGFVPAWTEVYVE